MGFNVSNPNKVETVDNRTPEEIITEIERLRFTSNKSLAKNKKSYYELGNC